MASIEPLTDPNQFIDVLAKSELLTTEALISLRGTVSAATDATALARQLIKEGSLTRWQASQLLRQYTALTIGPYRLLDQIGKGPTGRVYLAEHDKLGKKVSLRVLPARFSSQPDLRKRFLDEANRAGALNHRNLIHIFDAGSDGDRYYLSVEYVEGKDFQRLVETSGPVGAAQAIGLMRQVADGLAHAHEQGLTHGNLKPSGLLVDAAGVVKIFDLGLSGLIENPVAEEGGDESTESPTLASLAFRAPELLSGSQRPDVRSDLFSVGAILFFLLTGKTPPRNAAEVAKALDQAPGITPELANLGDHLLAENPQERPDSAAQVAAALELVARALGGPEKTPDRPSSAGKPGRKPLMAKPLEDASDAVTVAADDSATDDDRPVGSFAIKTGSKRRAAPAAAPAIAAASPAAETSPAPKATRSGSRLPLIVAGVIGGGVLVVAAMITIIVLILTRGGSTEVASASKSQGVAQTASGSGAQSDGELNPESSTEANPEADPAASADAAKGPAPDVQPTGADGQDVANSKAPPPVEPSAAAAQPEKTETKSEPAKTEPTKTEPTKTEPTKTEQPAKTDAKTAPTPSPPPAQPPPPAANPFEGFATAVTLPALDPMDKAADATSAAALGPVKIQPGALCLIKLKGGDSAFKTAKFLLEPAQQGTAERDWEFKVQEGAAEPAVIATLSLKEDQLHFQWTDQAAEEQAAPYLCNCVLAMSAGAGTHQAALRKPQTVEPLAIEASKGAVNQKYALEHAPGGKQIVVEFGPLIGGPPKNKIDPKVELSALKDSTYLFTGTADDALFLGFKLDVSMPAKTLEIMALPQYYIPKAMNSPARFVKNTPSQLAQQVGRQLQTANFKANVAKAIRDDRKKKQAEEVSKGELDLAQKNMAQIDQLKEIAKLLDEGAQLHFRASYMAEDVKVELITSGGPPPAAAAAAPKPADAKK